MRHWSFTEHGVTLPASGAPTQRRLPGGAPDHRTERAPSAATGGTRPRRSAIARDLRA
jgi:hypothetical protein